MRIDGHEIACGIVGRITDDGVQFRPRRNVEQARIDVVGLGWIAVEAVGIDEAHPVALPLQRFPREPGKFRVLRIGDDLAQVRGAGRDKVGTKKPCELSLSRLRIDRDRFSAAIDQWLAPTPVKAEFDAAPDIPVCVADFLHSRPERRIASSSSSCACPS